MGKTLLGQVDRWLDASSNFVIPGLINTHIHVATSPKDKSFLEDIGLDILLWAEVKHQNQLEMKHFLASFFGFHAHEPFFDPLNLNMYGG